MEKTPATPAAAMAGVRATGIHIIRLAKLARSCSSQISTPVISAPIARQAGQAPLEAAVAHVLKQTIDTDETAPASVLRSLAGPILAEPHARISVILSRNRVLAMVAFRG